jgi:nucleotide-binding universal stress UspA family protein
MADVYPVVVGTDGSAHAAVAEAAAAADAQRRGLPLRLVYSFAPLYGFAGLDPTPPENVLEACQEIIDREIEGLREHYPDLEISGEVLVQDPAVALVKETESADILYVGARGLGAIRRFLLGSVSNKVAAYGKCPVVVVRHAPVNTHGPVVVGMDPDDGSPAAVDFAYRQARARGVALRVIQARQHAAANVNRVPEGALREAIRSGVAGLESSGKEAFDNFDADYPDVHATLDVVSGHAVDALLAASEDASLLVVGNHGRNALAMLGSVSSGVLHGGAAVVAVVPAE